MGLREVFSAGRLCVRRRNGNIALNRLAEQACNRGACSGLLSTQLIRAPSLQRGSPGRRFYFKGLGDHQRAVCAVVETEETAAGDALESRIAVRLFRPLRGSTALSAGERICDAH